MIEFNKDDVKKLIKKFKVKKMKYQSIIDGLAITVILCLILTCLCIVGIGIATYKRDKAFEKSQKEYKEQMIELGQQP